MKLHRTTPAAMDLWRRGAIALAKVEAAGVRIDKGHLDAAIVDCGNRIRDAQRRLTADRDFRAHWVRRFGEKTNPASYDQLAEVMFKCLGFKGRGTKTESGDRESARRAAFEGISHPIKDAFFEAASLIKARNTFLYGIRRELVQHDDGLWYVHPSYNLNTVITFRSSSDGPNYQQNPKRDQRMAEIVRRCYIPRPGRCLGEIDYGQIEVRVPCAVNFDPQLIQYVTDPTTDMHRDMACQIFRLKKEQVSKALRNIVKTWYVFATFYGSYYGLTAKSLWEEIDIAGAKLEGSDKTVRQHVTEMGYTELGDPDDVRDGTWMAWVRSIDEDFWGRRFRVYAEWRRRTWDEYCRDGGFSMVTGFAVNAPLDKKQVCNSQIQGPAFHLLLWSMCELVDWLERYKMKTVVVGEVHDSINIDVAPEEADDVFLAARHFMTKKVTKFAPWLNVPLVVEPEISPVNGSWYDVKGCKPTGW